MRTISYLHWHEKYTLCPPQIFEQILIYCSQLPTLLAEKVLEKFCRGSWTSQVTAAGRLPQEAREKLFVLTQLQSFSSADPKVP